MGLLLPVENSNIKLSSEWCKEQWSKLFLSYLPIFISRTVLKQELKDTLLLVQLALMQEVTMSCELEFECRMKRGSDECSGNSKIHFPKENSRKRMFTQKEKRLKGIVHSKKLSFASFHFLWKSNNSFGVCLMGSP